MPRSVTVRHTGTNARASFPCGDKLIPVEGKGEPVSISDAGKAGKPPNGSNKGFEDESNGGHELNSESKANIWETKVERVVGDPDGLKVRRGQWVDAVIVGGRTSGWRSRWSEGEEGPMGGIVDATHQTSGPARFR